MRTEVRCTGCGSPITVELRGTETQVSRAIASTQWKCTECRGRESAGKNAERGLPPIVGSERQGRWAEAIRDRRWEDLSFVTRGEGTELAARCHSALFSRREARWWIETRDMTSMDLMQLEDRNVSMFNPSKGWTKAREARNG